MSNISTTAYLLDILKLKCSNNWILVACLKGLWLFPNIFKMNIVLSAWIYNKV
jgi:hypothetical protein